MDGIDLKLRKCIFSMMFSLVIYYFCFLIVWSVVATNKYSTIVLQFPVLSINNMHSWHYMFFYLNRVVRASYVDAVCRKRHFSKKECS